MKRKNTHSINTLSLHKFQDVNLPAHSVVEEVRRLNLEIDGIRIGIVELNPNFKY